MRTILYAPFARKAPQLQGACPKDYPFAKELADELVKEHSVIQVGGKDDEQLVKTFIKDLSFEELRNLINGCETAICVDSYLQHAMWYCNKRAIVLWGVSDPKIFGHSMHLNLLRDRKYLRPNQFDLYYSNQFNPEAFVKPSKVIEALKRF